MGSNLPIPEPGLDAWMRGCVCVRTEDGFALLYSHCPMHGMNAQPERWSVEDGTPGPAREAAPEKLAEWLFATYRRSKAEWLELSADAQARWRQDAIDMLSFLRAELARAPNGWEQAAKIADEHAALYRQRTADGSEYSDIEAHACEQLAVSLRAAAPDAERRAPAP